MNYWITYLQSLRGGQWVLGKLEAWESWWCHFTSNSMNQELGDTENVTPELSPKSREQDTEEVGIPAQEERVSLYFL